jgi:hypothetical protein
MTVLTYAYLLRVPLLAWGLLVALPWLAIPTDAAAGTLLRGLFDLSDQAEHGPLWTWGLGIFAFAQLTIVTLMAVAAIGITARLIILDGHERFDVPAAPLSLGIELMVRLLPLLAGILLIGGAWIQSHETVASSAVLTGILAGLAVFLFVMRPAHNWLWDRVFPPHPPAPATPAPNWLILAARTAFEGFWLFVRRTPEGFVTAGGFIRERHAFALFQLLFTFLLYLLLFLFKLWAFDSGPPTICMVLLLVTLMVWGLTAGSFTLDRFRVPLIVPIVAYGWLMSVFPQGDHFFPSTDRPGGHRPSISPAQVLAARAGKPAIVVAATGGGIQASAWTARVLAGLQHDSTACGDDFDQAVLAISAVSGGSVGAMYIADAYRGGRLPAMANLDAEPSVKAAEASSLDQVAWALTYPDLVWTLAPFLKGVWPWPPHLANGPLLTVDRGKALEDAWKRTDSLKTVTLDDWRVDVAAHQRPAVIFNSTIVETGERMLFATTTIDGTHGAGRVDFGTDARYQNADVQVVTAARMSATFPYVSPPARIQLHGVYDAQYHLVDGGYYDNYGTATLMEWLDQGLRTSGASKPSRILVLEVRAFPTTLEPPSPDGRRGWVFETVHPAETLYNVRGAGQLAHSDTDVRFIKQIHPEVESRVIEFPRSLPLGEDAAEPLSWHLTPLDRVRLRAAWATRSTVDLRKAVHEFLRGSHDVNTTNGGTSCIQ